MNGATSNSRKKLRINDKDKETERQREREKRKREMQNVKIVSHLCTLIFTLTETPAKKILHVPLDHEGRKGFLTPNAATQ